MPKEKPKHLKPDKPLTETKNSLVYVSNSSQIHAKEFHADVYG